MDHQIHDRWQASGVSTLLERVREKVARLLSAERSFSLSPEQQASLERVVAVALDNAQR